MKQDAFIQRLRLGLARLPKREVEEIVADYREYVGDAIAAGRAEEEVIAALGDPDKLARELKAQATFRQWQARRSFGNLARVVASIAGLGLLNLVLLFPFLVYLLLLTAGYMVSGAFAIGGLVAVVSLGSHALFGWPPLEKSSIHVSAKPSRAASDASNSKDIDARNGAPDIDGVKLEGDHIVLNLDDGSKASIVTRDGRVVMQNEDGKMKIVALGNADKLMTPAGRNTYRIATKDIVSMEIKDDDGGAVSLSHASGDASTLVWDIRDDGAADADHVQFEQDAHGDTHRLAVKSGADSVVVDSSKGISIKDGEDSVNIATSMGCPLGAMTFRRALTMLAGGVLGLFICVWLTRVTWRALSRYVHRQIEAVSARLDGHEQTGS